tara:strand:+ start:211 stop:426 length:216 start_codon:yes stop_codon:yes gene_type:complete
MESTVSNTNKAIPPSKALKDKRWRPAPKSINFPDPMPANEDIMRDIVNARDIFDKSHPKWMFQFNNEAGKI